MVSFFIWTLVKLLILVGIGYLISKAISSNQDARQHEILAANYEQELKDHAYDAVHEDVEQVMQVKGLPMLKQKFNAYEKPVFYFQLDHSATDEGVKTFLVTLPGMFEVIVPALKLSIEDGPLQDVYFWKCGLDNFHLAIKQYGNYQLLADMNAVSLTSKIMEASNGYNLQNIRVEKINPSTSA